MNCYRHSFVHFCSTGTSVKGTKRQVLGKELEGRHVETDVLKAKYPYSYYFFLCFFQDRVLLSYSNLQSFCFSLPNSWDSKCVPLHLATLKVFAMQQLPFGNYLPSSLVHLYGSCGGNVFFHAPATMAKWFVQRYTPDLSWTNFSIWPTDWSGAD